MRASTSGAAIHATTAIAYGWSALEAAVERQEDSVEFIRYGGTPPRGCPSALWDDLCLTGLPKKVITIFKASPEPVLASANLDGHRTNGIVLGYSREDQ